MVANRASRVAKTLVTMVTLCACLCVFRGVAAASGPWWNAAWRYRVPVVAGSAAYDRVDKPAEFSVNFTQLLSALGQAGSLDLNSIRVVEVDNQQQVIDTAVAYQFDQDPGFDPVSNAAGKLVVIMSGSTPANTSRYYHAYFEVVGRSIPPQQVASLVVLTDNVTDKGQSSVRVAISGSTLFYHKEGGGFSTWLDANGNDWIGYSTATGAAGDFRGIPNAAYPESYFHPGRTSASTSVVSQGPVKAKIHTVTNDGKWECTWEFYPRYARMQMTKIDHPYWLLYEGTPGGTLEPSVDFMYTSDGTKTFLSDSWTADIPGNEWAYFSDPNVGGSGRSLYLALDEQNTNTDSYFLLGTPPDAMTVFGFGRDGTTPYQTSTTDHLTIGIFDGTDFTQSGRVIMGANQPIDVSVGTPEQQVVLAAPVLTSPANGASGQPTSLTFSWNASSGATSYHLQVATDPAFATGVAVNDSTIADVSRGVSGLAPNTMYYWRVRAKSAGGSSPFSSNWSFSTGLAVPTLVSPANGATNQSTTLSLVWRSVGGATSYRLQVAANSGFTGGFILDDSTIVDTTKIVTNLSGGTQYYWRVNAKSGAGAGGFSPAWSFTTTVPVPLLLFPANNAVAQPTSLGFVWTSVPGAVSYRLQVATDPNFAGGVFLDDANVTDTSRVVSGLAGSTSYYWRVNARIGGSSGAFSAVWLFTTSSASLTLLEPANGALKLPVVLTFRWASVAGATTYHLQLGTDSTLATALLKDDSSLVDTQRVVAGLQRKTKYFWHVAAKVGGVASGFSPTWGFVTIGDLPTQVALVSPGDGANVGSDTVLFVWQRSQPAVTRYWLEIAIDSLFNFHTIDSSITDTAKSVVVVHSATPTYWWRVQAANSEGWGPLSEQRQFKIVPVSVAEQKRDLPKDFGLTRNYPNPFNPSTQIEFTLASESHVKLEVFNLLGQQVALLVDDVRPVGRYTVRFDAAGLPSGIYICRLNTHGSYFTLKMVLMK